VESRPWHLQHSEDAVKRGVVVTARAEIWRIRADSTQPQALQFLGKLPTLLGGDRPELIADYAKSLDWPIVVQTSE